MQKEKKEQQKRVYLRRLWLVHEEGAKEAMTKGHPTQPALLPFLPILTPPAHFCFFGV